ncbi:hypothetical protein VE03_02624 [Pseudogymnoascus sp. 23342-1-I1]|nr:hypothetical protein VE03_02624 [Pseudogymnoascus sp. 23342-1-I1]
MKASRYASSRQKSCQQCSDSKARSNTRGDARLGSNTDSLISALVPGASYPSPNSDLLINAGGSNPTLPHHTIDTQTIINDADFVVSSGPPGCIPESRIARHPDSSAAGEVPEKPDILDFSHLDLICPINVDDISNRWLNPYISSVGQEIKEYPAPVTRFIYRVLKSYAAVAARGRDTLPFVHPVQMKTPGSRLTTCLSLVRISENPLPGSEDTAAIILQREMENIAQVRDDYDDISLLAAFQAYLIYTMILFFRLSQKSNPFFRSAMMNLQELACSSSRRGLVCTVDAIHTRPRWEEWIVAEAKRRTLYVMYLFDSVMSAHENLPTFLGTELRGLPAPSNKSLWQAQNRSDWEKEYNIFLVEWTEGRLTIDELWLMPREFDNTDIIRRRRRVDQWLENLDEFGTMTFAVTGCTHVG